MEHLIEHDAISVGQPRQSRCQRRAAPSNGSRVGATPRHEQQWERVQSELREEGAAGVGEMDARAIMVCKEAAVRATPRAVEAVQEGDRRLGRQRGQVRSKVLVRPARRLPRGLWHRTQGAARCFRTGGEHRPPCRVVLSIPIEAWVVGAARARLAAPSGGSGSGSGGGSGGGLGGGLGGSHHGRPRRPEDEKLGAVTIRVPAPILDGGCHLALDRCCVDKSEDSEGGAEHTVPRRGHHLTAQLQLRRICRHR